MAFNTIILSLSDDLARLTLNRPDKLNSFTQQMHEELIEALDEVENSQARALIITGEGRGFCAGQDLGDPAFEINDDFDAGDALEKNYNPLIKRIQNLPIPVIAAVNGVAAGAGANLAFACDIVIAARSASFIQAFAKIGLIPDAGGTWILPRKIGMARAMGLAMLAMPLAAEKACDWGLIWQVVDDDELDQTATQTATYLAAQPTKALANIKKALHASTTNDMAAQLELERELQSDSSKSHDFREGVSAFFEKRKPTFTGN